MLDFLLQDSLVLIFVVITVVFVLVVWLVLSRIKLQARDVGSMGNPVNFDANKKKEFSDRGVQDLTKR